ncbi:MAG TPA: hypothetical protein VFY79_09080 [Dehalococcoidia bacterium]|nr:hypothetical protein [Dehalococcoidia bacterium]
MTPQEHLPRCDGHHTPRQACNSLARDAVPTHLSRQAPASWAAVAATVEPEVEAQEVTERRHAIADGPVDTIDTAHIPVLPLAGLAVLTLASVLVLWRLFARRARA